jgi:SdrD B-like domain
MNWYLQSLVRLCRSLRTDRRRSTPAPGTRLELEPLEERALLSSGVSAIASNFNGASIPAGDVVWFSSAFKINGVGSSPVTLDVTNETITFAGNTVSVPDSHITLTPGQTNATTSFDGAWEVSLPTKFSGNGFLGGAAFPVTSTLPGGINPVTWQATFSTNTGGISVNWQWAAAVYTKFDSTLATDNIKATDDNHFAPNTNSDHAGTPEAFTAFVVEGARGGGGSNFTGSMSGTASLQVPVGTSQGSASLSGFVDRELTVNSSVPVQGLTLTLTNSQGQVVATTTTAADGSYSFNNLAADTYTITLSVPPLFDVSNMPGTVNGVTDGRDGSNGSFTLGVITGITLAAGNQGVNYDFLLLQG